MWKGWRRARQPLLMEQLLVTRGTAWPLSNQANTGCKVCSIFIRRIILKTAEHSSSLLTAAKANSGTGNQAIFTASQSKCASTPRRLRRLKFHSARSCRKSPIHLKQNTSNMSKFRVSSCPISGGRRSILELMFYYRPALMNIRRPAIHSLFTTDISLTPLKASAKNLRIRILNRIIMSDFISAVTTEWLRKKLMLFINTGQPATRRVFSSLRFNMPILFMMIPTRLTQPILVHTVMPLTTS